MTNKKGELSEKEICAIFNGMPDDFSTIAFVRAIEAAIRAQQYTVSDAADAANEHKGESK